MTGMQFPASIRKAAHTLLWIGFGLLLAFWLRIILTYTHVVLPLTCSDDGMLQTIWIVGPLIIALCIPAVVDILVTRIRQLVKTGSMMANDDASLFPDVRKARCLLYGLAAYAVLELISILICVG
ncbi:MAG: hypothetical protein IPH75_07515 [bacterium]|nr:hypothetical protein [bacterium]